MVTRIYRGISLSASATVNGWPMPAFTSADPIRRGDFAAGWQGKARRVARRTARAGKRAFLNANA